MSELIFKLFIKDKDNVTNENVRLRYGVVGGAVGIVLNIILCIIKFLAGIITSSISITADAVNNLSDAGSSIITIVGFKLSNRKPDNIHPFGHGRIEYISALFVSVAIILMGFELAKSSVEKIINPESVSFSVISCAILIISILVKFWMYMFNRKIGIKISSQSVIANAKDSLSDCISTFAVLIGLIIGKLYNINIDGYFGLLVALFIFYTGYSTMKESISPLLGVPPTKEMVDAIKETVHSHPEIIGMHDLVIHNYGPTRFMVSLHAEVSADKDVIMLHEHIDDLEKELNEKLGCEAVIHMDPIETKNELVTKTKEVVCGIIKNIDDSLTLHDFRMVTGVGHTNVIFDVVVPFGFRFDNSELDKIIKDKIKEYNKSYLAVVEYDNLYV